MYIVQSCSLILFFSLNEGMHSHTVFWAWYPARIAEWNSFCDHARCNINQLWWVPRMISFSNFYFVSQFTCKHQALLLIKAHTTNCELRNLHSRILESRTCFPLETQFSHHPIKGEVHPKMITSYLVVLGALSRMVKVRGAYDKPFWIYKRLNNCAAPTPASDDVLEVEEEVFLCAGHAKDATTKTSSLAGAGAAQLFNRLHIQNGFSHAPLTFTIQLSAPNTTRYEVIIFGWTSPLGLGHTSSSGVASASHDSGILEAPLQRNPYRIVTRALHGWRGTWRRAWGLAGRLKKILERN